MNVLFCFVLCRFRKRSSRWHPTNNLDDKERAEFMYNEICKAYGVLSDSKHNCFSFTT